VLARNTSQRTLSWASDATGRPDVFLELDGIGKRWSGKAESVKTQALSVGSPGARNFGDDGPITADLRTHSLGPGETVRTEEVLTLRAEDVPHEETTRHARVVFLLGREVPLPRSPERPRRLMGNFYERVVAEAPLKLLGGERPSLMGRGQVVDMMLETERMQHWLEGQERLGDVILRFPDDADRRWKLTVRGDKGALDVALDPATSEVSFPPEAPRS